MAGFILPFAAALTGALAWAGTRALVKVRSDRRALDDTLGGLRKVHVSATPRIGGAAVALALFVGAGICMLGVGDVYEWSILLLCAVPGLVWGLIEDFTKRGAVPVRLALTALGGVLAYVLLDARLTKIDVPGIDYLLAMDGFSFAFTVFAVCGTAHAVNVIDGLNGLCGFTTLLASIGLAIVAWMVGDTFVLSVSCVLAASIAGFLVVNFPRGRIFLGDGGAYLVGLVLGVLSVMLVHRNSEVSPWFSPVLLAFPLWETLFSMYRRKVRGHSTGRADALHLHFLVYRRLVRWRGKHGNPFDYARRNSLASVCMWTLPLICFACALVFWNDSAALMIAGWTFNAVYVVIYFCFVRFKIPAWAVLRASTGIPAELARDDETDTMTAMR
jgi:UDP-N-acetylmuramyl pentapeptide phosphotransferase/UDP-N-acetylglucosamine-1-phosphate transferase